MSSELYLEISAAASAGATQEMCLQLRWQAPTLNGASVSTCVSPVTQSVAGLLARYVAEFRSWRRNEWDRAQMAERTLLTLGRALGGCLVDPDCRLLSFCEAVESEGIESLHVTVRADTPCTLEVPWEALILPDSSFALAAAAASFVRTPAELDPFEHPICELNLDERSEPLRCLRVDSDRTERDVRLSQAWKQAGWEGALSYRVSASLLSAAGRWDVVHWSGFVVTREPELSVSEAGAGELSLRALVEHLRALDTRLLILDPDSSGGIAVDELACALIREGIDNVVTLSQSVELGWPSAWHDELIDCIGSGLTVRQAVVETRKRLQRSMLEARQADPAPPHAPQLWHAIRHYSGRDVRFFSQPVARVPWESSQQFGEMRAKLFGFKSEYLPPLANEQSARTPLRMLELLAASGAAILTSVPGGGLSHALHSTALLACGAGEVSRAYYWDFTRERFTAQDVLEMVAGVHGEKEPANVTEESVLQQLSKQRELFVFDNLESLERSDSQCIDELMALAERVVQRGGFCLLGTHHALPAHRSSFPQREVPALSEVEQVALVHAKAPHVLGLGRPVWTLLEALQGNPLVLSRVVADCSADNVVALLDEATRHYGTSVARAEQSQRFYAYRWQQLEPHWRLLLQAWLPLGTLYLQTLMVAVDLRGGERSGAGRKLWQLLDAPEAASCTVAISRLQALGFASASRHGAQVDQAAQRFIRSQRLPELPPGLDQALASAVCLGASRVLERRGQAGREAISAHLFEHHLPLRQQVELVAQIPDHALAVTTFLQLHPLLLHGGAPRAATDWANALLDLVGRDLCTHLEPALGIAWLTLAMRAEHAPASAELMRGARYFFDLLVKRELQSDAQLHPMIPMAVTLLQRLYDQLGDLSSYQTVASLACEHYRTQHNPVALVSQLAGLAAVEHVIGNTAERDVIEQELLDTLHENLPAELRARTLAQLARMRLRRSDDHAAEQVVQLLESETKPFATNAVAVVLRAELAMQREQWEIAANHYCVVWAAAMTGAKVDANTIDATARALEHLEHRLGGQRFAALYDAVAGAETPTPRALRAAS
ncbi:MAG TPA: hypothetical protein VFN67_29630 [Polyangiales bacterium]|nr:hypothetical protein [Polyangiales bacterium]